MSWLSKKKDSSQAVENKEMEIGRDFIQQIASSITNVYHYLINWGELKKDVKKTVTSPQFIMSATAIMLVGLAWRTHKSLTRDKQINNLPLLMNGMVRREKLIDEMTLKLKSQTKAIKQAAFVGLSGSGKSELTKVIAQDYLNSWYHSDKSAYFKTPVVWFIDCNSLVYSFKQLAEKLGLSASKLQKTHPEVKGDNSRFEKALRDGVYDALKSHPGWFIIFDDVKPKDTTEIDFWQPRLQGLRGTVLYTTQNISHLSSKQRVDVSDGLTEAESVELLDRHAGLSNRKGAASLAQTLDYSPLALMVAGIYIKHQREKGRKGEGDSYESYGALYKESLQKLSPHLKRVLLQHQNSVSKKGNNHFPPQLLAIHVSLKSLKPDVRALLVYCSHFSARRLSLSMLSEFVGSYYSEQKLTKEGLTRRTHSLITSAKSRDLLRDESHGHWFLHDATKRVVLETFSLSLNTGDSSAERCFTAILNTLKLHIHGQIDKPDVYTRKREFNESYRPDHKKLSGFDASNWSLGLRAKYTNSLKRWGEMSWLLGDYDSFGHYLKRAKELIDKDNPKSALAGSVYHFLGILANCLSQHELELKYYQQSLSIRRGVHGEDVAHLNIAESLHNIATCYFKQGELEKAFGRYQEALAMSYTLYGKEADKPLIALTLSNLGVIYQEQGKYSDALSHYQKALTMRQVIYGKDANHAEIASSLHALGSVYRAQGKPDLSLTYFQESLKMYRVIYGKDANHANIAHSLHGLGFLYLLQSKPDLSLSHFQDALTMRRVVYGKTANHTNIASSLQVLGSLYLVQNKPELSLSHFQDALTMRRVVYGKDANHTDIANSLHALGSVYRAQGKPDLSLSHFQDALTMRRVVYGKDANHANIANSLHALGSVYLTQGKPDLSLTYFQESLKMYRVIYGANSTRSEIIILTGMIDKLKLISSDEKEREKNEEHSSGSRLTL